MNRRELLQTFVLANEFKEGDLLVGGTMDARVREEARRSIGAMSLGELRKSLFVEDVLSETLHGSLDSQLAAEISHLTISQLKSILLSAEGPGWAMRYRDGLSSEAIAATAKVMTNAELSMVAQGLFNPLPGQGTTIGSAGHFGSRIQPNSAGDD